MSARWHSACGRLHAGGSFPEVGGSYRLNVASFDPCPSSHAPDTLPFGAKDIDDGATPTQESTVTNSGKRAGHADRGPRSAARSGGAFEHLTDQGSDCANTGR